MARDRKRSKQRQQRRARAHRDDDRATAQRALGRDAEEDAGALNVDEQRDELGEPVAEARAADAVEAPADDELPEARSDHQPLAPLADDNLPAPRPFAAFADFVAGKIGAATPQRADPPIPKQRA